MSIPKYTAYNGYQVPQLGLGTYKLKGQSGVQAIKAALEMGYSYIDTAYNYENEATVGEAIHQSGVNRQELQVASKLPGRYHAYEDALVTIEESLLRANLDYYDLYLIHWPNPKEDKYVEAWQALIEAKKRGYVKEIGVSNFLPHHIDRLVAETGIKPVVNQVELHPLFDQADQRAYDDQNGIITQSWSPLGRANEKGQENVMELPGVLEVAEKHGKSAGQVILRWHLQLGAMPIPKSSKAERLQENFAVFDFELDEDDMTKISQYSREDGRLSDQNPDEYQEF